MPGKAEFDAVVARLNAATSAAGTKINDLRSQLATSLSNAGALGPEEDATLAQLGQVADALEAMAQDPANPVPVDPNPPEPEPTPVDPTA